MNKMKIDLQKPFQGEKKYYAKVEFKADGTFMDKATAAANALNNLQKDFGASFKCLGSTVHRDATDEQGRILWTDKELATAAFMLIYYTY